MHDWWRVSVDIIIALRLDNIGAIFGLLVAAMSINSRLVDDIRAGWLVFDARGGAN